MASEYLYKNIIIQIEIQPAETALNKFWYSFAEKGWQLLLSYVHSTSLPPDVFLREQRTLGQANEYFARIQLIIGINLFNHNL